MLGTYAVENIVGQQMKKYGMAALFLGELCQLYGIPASKTRLSAALRGDRPLSNEVGSSVRQLVEEIADYCDSLQTPIALTDAAQIKLILDQRRLIKHALKEIPGVNDAAEIENSSG